MKNVKFSIVLVIIGMSHFFNAVPSVERLDIGQTLEQVENIISQRKAIKTMHKNIQNKKQCITV